MKTIVIVYIAALGVILLAVATNGDVDCETFPKFVNPKECCPIPNLISQELIEKCQTHMGPPPADPENMAEDNDEMQRGPPPHGPAHGHHHHGRHGHHKHCFFSCVFNETGILMDGQLNENNLDTFLDSATEESPDMKPLLKKSFQECYEKSQEIMDKIEQQHKQGPPKHSHGPPPHKRCPPQAGIIFHCAMMKTFKECPESIWNDTEECNAMREYFNECKKPSKEDEDEI
ncbi:uncharacterized protein LOC142240894 [Haematobia irritans]|uniref:uncharacterized protein LOC142240894 n=1 Tax=Haematobia irritans TaxID=7368 RepID=UPI003F506C6B